MIQIYLKNKLKILSTNISPLSIDDEFSEIGDDLSEISEEESSEIEENSSESSDNALGSANKLLPLPVRAEVREQNPLMPFSAASYQAAFLPVRPLPVRAEVPEHNPLRSFSTATHQIAFLPIRPAVQNQNVATFDTVATHFVNTSDSSKVTLLPPLGSLGLAYTFPIKPMVPTQYILQAGENSGFNLTFNVLPSFSNSFDGRDQPKPPPSQNNCDIS